MIRSLVSLTLCSLSAFWFISCCPEDPFVPTRPPVVIDSAKQTYLRFVIADPNLDPVDITVNGESVFPQPLGFFEYPEKVYEAQFWPVDTGTSELAFTLPGGTPVATTTITLPQGTYHTAYLYREGDDHRILVTADDPTNKPGNSNVRYRIVNLAVGAPTVDVQFADEPPVVEDLAYGDTTEIFTRRAGFIDGGLTVTESTSGRVIFDVADILLSGDAVVTLVLGGKLRPLGDERMIFLGILQDSRYDPLTELYGYIPLPFELLALKFVNIVSSGDSTLDLTLYDQQYGGDFPDNFRRNFPGQRNATIQVAPLGAPEEESQKGYFFLSTFLYTALPYRIEVTDPSNPGGIQPQTVLVPRVEFPIQSNRRYTVVAYGPFAQGQAQAVTIFDRVPAPPQGEAGLRFFHGDYGTNRTEELRIRINGDVSPQMSYGEAPDPLAQSFNATAGSGLSISLLNEAGTVIHTENNVTLKPGATYTIFLSRGPDGSGLLLTPVSEEVVPE